MRFSKLCSSYTALATSWNETTPSSVAPVLDRHVTRVAFEHRAAQLHDVEPGRRDHRIAHVNLAHLEIAELPLALGQCLEHFGEREHPQPSGHGP